VPAFACAHRGLSAEQPENTLAAFRAAADAGFRALEMDLRLTADGEVVVLHDAGLERTTDGNGRVADMRYDDLRRHPTAAGPVPRLDDALSSLERWPGLWNLEIKAVKATVPALNLLEHHRAVGRAQVSSMDPRALEAARDEAPDVPRGLIALGPIEEDALDLAEELECAWINADHEFLEKAAVDAMLKADVRVAAWTVNDPARAVELAAWGVECVITDTRDVLAALAGQAPAKPSF
jgi:glycerophosphoryl diester phosphodiesterase